MDKWLKSSWETMVIFRGMMTTLAMIGIDQLEKRRKLKKSIIIVWGKILD